MLLSLQPQSMHLESSVLVRTVDVPRLASTMLEPTVDQKLSSRSQQKYHQDETRIRSQLQLLAIADRPSLSTSKKQLQRCNVVFSFSQGSSIVMQYIQVSLVKLAVCLVSSRPWQGLILGV